MKGTLLRTGLFFILLIGVIGSSMWMFSSAGSAGEQVDQKDSVSKKEVKEKETQKKQKENQKEEKGSDSKESNLVKNEQTADSKSTPSKTRPKKENKPITPQIIYRGAKKEKVVALTFDDGPDSTYTPEVLNILREKGILATFFVLGKMVRSHPDITLRIVKEGHTIANHSWSHAYLPKLKGKQIEKELMQTHREVKRLTGMDMSLHRAPYGAVKGVEKRIADHGYRIIHWDVDSWDWKSGRNSRDILNGVKKQVQPGSIVLLHSAGGDPVRHGPDVADADR